MSVSRSVFSPKTEGGMSGPPKKMTPSAFLTICSNSGVQAFFLKRTGSLISALTTWNLNQSRPFSRTYFRLSAKSPVCRS